MSVAETAALFADARRIDRALAVARERLAALARKRVHPTAYARDTLFRHIADGTIALFHDHPPPLVPELRAAASSETLGREIAARMRRIRSTRGYRVRSGPSGTLRHHTIADIARRWSRGRALLSVTDLPVRDTGLERIVDPAALSAFNLYCACEEPASTLEMMTLVVGTRRALTDSHSDDSDGSNHCFCGRKLWLTWDTHRGLARGLEDVERVAVRDRARFSMDTFLSLPGSRWFTVEPGQTLFLPGHLTHRVVTLRDYIGVGSFFVTPANSLRTLSRWLTHPPNWQLNEPPRANALLITNLVDSLARVLDGGGRARWGLDHLRHSLRTWERRHPARRRAALQAHPQFRRCLDLIAAT